MIHGCTQTDILVSGLKKDMAEILHRIGIKTVSIETVFKALTTIEGLAGWWTTETFGIADAEGGLLQFRFGAGGFDIRIVKLDRPNFVSWQVVAMEKEWLGTTINWELKQEGD